MSDTKFTFFKQSGWMVFATVAGGIFMFAVHKAAGKMDKTEYGVFLTLLQVLNLMAIPSIGLQTIVMRQTVAALSETQRRELNRAIRTLLAGTFFLWLFIGALAFGFQQVLIERWKISNPAALHITIFWGLGAFWLPIFTALLQGRQNFLWMGGVGIAGGLVRLIAVSVIVLLLGGQAAGAAFGVLIALVLPAGLAAWHSRDIWLGPGEAVPWRDWLRHVLPLTLGPGAVTFMMSQDMLIVQSAFPEQETAYYGAAGMIGRALVFLTAPLTAVMFPKIVNAAARAQKSDAMLLALGATALLGVGAALACTVFPSLPLRIVYDASFLKISWLVPWFAWCMLPLTLGTVLVNNLVAREQYQAVPWIVAVAAGYGVALRYFHASFLQVVQVLGIFGLMLIAVCLWFTLRGRQQSPPQPVALTQPAD